MQHVDSHRVLAQKLQHRFYSILLCGRPHLQRCSPAECGEEGGVAGVPGEAQHRDHTVRISFGCQIIEISGASSYNVQKLFIVSDNVSQAKIICRRCF